jgi:hypothetical protein
MAWDDKLNEAWREELKVRLPELSFWYGIPPSELIDTPNWLLDAYTKQLPVLKAEYEAMLNNAAVYPYLSPAKQREAASDIKRRMNGGRPVKRVLPKGSFKGTVAGVGIGMK